MKGAMILAGLVLLLADVLVVNASSARGGCQRRPVFTDYIELFKEGDEWRERCRTCHCENGEITCALDAGKTCSKEYDPSMDRLCVEWDEDECCCLKTGCKVDGKVYALGEYYPTKSPPGCKETCQCVGFGAQDCLMSCSDVL